MAEGSWKPANEPELMMYHALLRSDTERYLRILRESPLYVPALSEPARRLVTWERGDRSFLPVFSSPEGLARSVGTDADTVLRLSYDALARDWPDPSSWLVVNPTTPIEASGPVDDVAVPSLAAELPPAEMSGEEPFPVPENELEETFAEVLRQRNVPLLLDLLVFSEVLLPTLHPVPAFHDGPHFPWVAFPLVPDLPAAELAIGVFTSPSRLAESAPGLDVPFVRVPLLSVVAAWPGPDHALLVNPDSPLRARLPAGQVAGLLEWTRVATAYHGVTVS